MYLHKVVNLDKNLSKVQKNKELHKAAFNLLEENTTKLHNFLAPFYKIIKAR